MDMRGRSLTTGEAGNKNQPNAKQSAGQDATVRER
jgi:hypothetical protein